MKNIEVGDQVELSTTENSSFFGTVAAIGLLPSTTSGAATYPVTVDVTGTPKDLYDGVSVTAEVVYKKIADAVAVPSLAISQSNGTSTVQKVVDGKPVATTVTTGIEDGGYTQIVSGLSSGDTVQVTMARPGAGSSSTKSGSTGTTGGTGGTSGGAGFGAPGDFGGGTGTAPGAGQQGGN
jgi:macrolide-specific efflux system membrane fusion protein